MFSKFALLNFKMTTIFIVAVRINGCHVINEPGADNTHGQITRKKLVVCKLETLWLLFKHFERGTSCPVLLRRDGNDNDKAAGTERLMTVPWLTNFAWRITTPAIFLTFYSSESMFIIKTACSSNLIRYVGVTLISSPSCTAAGLLKWRRNSNKKSARTRNVFINVIRKMKLY